MSQATQPSRNTLVAVQVLAEVGEPRRRDLFLPGAHDQEGEGDVGTRVTDAKSSLEGKEQNGGTKHSSFERERQTIEEESPGVVLGACPWRLTPLSAEWPPHPHSPCILQRRGFLRTTPPAPSQRVDFNAPALPRVLEGRHATQRARRTPLPSRQRLVGTAHVTQAS